MSLSGEEGGTELEVDRTIEALAKACFLQKQHISIAIDLMRLLC